MIFLIAFGVENKKKLGKCVLPGALAWNGRGDIERILGFPLNIECDNIKISIVDSYAKNLCFSIKFT